MPPHSLITLKKCTQKERRKIINQTKKQAKIIEKILLMRKSCMLPQ